MAPSGEIMIGSAGPSGPRRDMSHKGLRGRAALNEFAAVAPDWLRAQAPTEWYERYGERIENDDLPKNAERQQLASVIGADGRRLLREIDAADRPELGALPTVRVLRWVWNEQYVETAGRVALRA